MTNDTLPRCYTILNFMFRLSNHMDDEQTGYLVRQSGRHIFLSMKIELTIREGNGKRSL